MQPIKRELTATPTPEPTPQRDDSTIPGKRELTATPTPEPAHDDTNAPSKPPAKRRASKSKAETIAQSGASKEKGKGREKGKNEQRAALALAVVRRGIAASLKDVEAIAQETGYTPAQIRNQLAPGRANVRKSLDDVAGTL